MAGIQINCRDFSIFFVHLLILFIKKCYFYIVFLKKYSTRWLRDLIYKNPAVMNVKINALSRLGVVACSCNPATWGRLEGGGSALRCAMSIGRPHLARHQYGPLGGA